MKCIRCNCEKFEIISDVLLREIYIINKNGSVSCYPKSKTIINTDMADEDNVIRCTNCGIEYVLLYSREYLLNNINFNKIILTEDMLTEIQLQ
mgnify:CR=1 FL=1